VTRWQVQKRISLCAGLVLLMLHLIQAISLWLMLPFVDDYAANAWATYLQFFHILVLTVCLVGHVLLDVLCVHCN
jgi:hypothetical protein